MGASQAVSSLASIKALPAAAVTTRLGTLTVLSLLQKSILPAAGTIMMEDTRHYSLRLRVLMQPEALMVRFFCCILAGVMLSVDKGHGAQAIFSRQTRLFRAHLPLTRTYRHCLAMIFC